MWLDSVSAFHNHTLPKFIETTDYKHPLQMPWGESLSTFTNKVTCTSSSLQTTVKYIHTPIEPTASIVRDPRKCWEQMTETYTQSKAYLIPLSGPGQPRAAAGCPYSPRSFLFDAGKLLNQEICYL